MLRARRIYEELEGSLYSIHELGQVGLSGKSKLPRFNMPFEAGIAYSLHERGVTGGTPHHMLLLDKAPYRIEVSMSDAAGIDGKAHGGTPSWRSKPSAASSAARADSHSWAGDSCPSATRFS